MPRETEGNGLAGYRRAAKSDVQATPTFRYFPSTGGNITYNKTALWLNTMERWLGWPTLQRIMSTHFDRWKFRHPQPADFFAIANDAGGRDLTWFFDRVYRSADVFDYGVDGLSASPDGSAFRSTVIVRRFGEATFPIDVRVTFDDGARVTEHWDGRDRWKGYSYVRPASVVSAEVDPEHVLLLDVNYTNNSKTLHASTDRASTKWSLKWMVWLQDCLLSWAALV
jgi:aminopeptidase N